MEVNISENEKQPFNGIRFSIIGLNENDKNKTGQSETITKVPAAEDNLASSQVGIDTDNKQSYD